MTKLTDSQLVVLCNAAAREDQTAVLPARMKAAALKVGASLVARKLMREVRAKAGAPVWREGEDGRGIALMITKAGLVAINAGDDQEIAAGRSNPGAQSSSQGKSKPQKQGARAARRESPDEPVARRTSPVVEKALKDAEPASPVKSKRATIIRMLSAKEGASLDALVSATGWLPHTTRAVLTGLRKKGFVIERVRNENVSTWRITEHPARDAA